MARALLFGSLFLYSACGIAYELLIAAFAGYVMGESLLLLCAIIGLFLTSMGVGAHLSRRVSDESAGRAYVCVGACLGVAGAGAPLAVLLVATQPGTLELVVGVATATCGALLGVAVPLCARLLHSDAPALRRLVAAVLAFDYLGALVGSLALPLAVLPAAGLVRGAAAIGCVCVVAAALAYVAGRRSPGLRAALLAAGLAVTALLVHGDRAFEWAFSRLARERVLHREHSPYQEILLSRGARGLALRLNGRIQVEQSWERRYHEALVHPALALTSPPPERVLVLGGGDGLAAREILKHASVRSITLVDLDPRMVTLAREQPALLSWNEGALDDPRLTVVHDDAYLWVRRGSDRFDAVLVDLPTPVSLSLSKLYTVEFYRGVAARLRPGGVVAVQSSAFDVSRRRVLACIGQTLEAARLRVRPYMLGRMGFHLAAHEEPAPETLQLRVPTVFLTTAFARGMFELPADLATPDVEANRLENHVLLEYMR